MSLPELSESTEMYLKAMAELGNRDAVGVARLAERLDVTHVSRITSYNVCYTKLLRASQLVYNAIRQQKLLCLVHVFIIFIVYMFNTFYHYTISEQR